MALVIITGKESKVLKFLGFMWNPLSWVMEAAALMAIGLSHGGPGDYHVFVGILVLLVINSTISFIEENNAGNEAAALLARLAPKAKEGDSLKIDQRANHGSKFSTVSEFGAFDTMKNDEGH
ncbi:hypothetical protein RJ639_024302, partial [Escallonia herrerae]